MKIFETFFCGSFEKRKCIAIPYRLPLYLTFALPIRTEIIKSYYFQKNRKIKFNFSSSVLGKLETI